MTIFLDKYWTRRVGGTSYPVSVPADGHVTTGGLVPTATDGDYLLRTYYFPTLRTHVATAGAPNALWWAACQVTALAWYTDISDTDFHTVDEDFAGMLIVEPLVVRMALDQPSVGGYTVWWQPQHGPLSARTGRKPGGGVTHPIVQFGLEILDPGLGIIAHLNAGTHTFSATVEETLWGTPA